MMYDRELVMSQGGSGADFGTVYTTSMAVDTSASPSAGAGVGGYPEKAATKKVSRWGKKK